MSKIVFLPGWGFKASIWQSFVNTYNLQDVLLLDFPGFKDKTIEEVISELASNIPNDATIVGWSLGGLLATYIAFKYPNKCKKLILPASLPNFISDGIWGGIPISSFQEFLSLAEDNIKKLLNRFYLLIQLPNKIDLKITEHLSPLDSSSLINYLHFMNDADAREIVSSLDIPVYYFIHSDDAILGSIPSLQLSKLGKHVNEVNLPGSHFSILNDNVFLPDELMDIFSHA